MNQFNQQILNKCDKPKTKTISQLLNTIMNY